jgi:hypothetical protein
MDVVLERHNIKERKREPSMRCTMEIIFRNCQLGRSRNLSVLATGMTSDQWDLTRTLSLDGQRLPSPGRRQLRG